MEETTVVRGHLAVATKPRAKRRQRRPPTSLDPGEAHQGHHSRQSKVMNKREMKALGAMRNNQILLIVPEKNKYCSCMYNMPAH